MIEKKIILETRTHWKTRKGLWETFCIPNRKYGEERRVSKTSIRIQGTKKEVHNKYQTPNIEELMNTVGR